MAHMQKPDFVFRQNGWVHLNRWGHQFSWLLATEVCASALVMLDTPLSEVVWEYWLPTPFASFPFTSPPVHHHVPSGFKRTLLGTLKAILWKLTCYYIITVSWILGMNIARRAKCFTAENLMALINYNCNIFMMVRVLRLWIVITKFAIYNNWVIELLFVVLLNRFTAAKNLS